MCIDPHSAVDDIVVGSTLGIKTIDEKMSARGGVRLYERGIGEASATVYDRFNRWKSGFFKSLPQVCYILAIACLCS
jgi:hypothetical protein